jgi:acetyl-CoA carboxylase biotin carboxylase subunit
MFSKVLVANRGAIARRVIHACNELGVASVAVFSDADGGAPYLEEATETVRLAGERALDTYLNGPALLDALRASGADALHPGYGFLAENGTFAREVVAAGAVFIGPDPRWLDAMGDKVEARRLAAQHGLPVFGGSEALGDPERALEVAAEIGYPVMLKPSAGGGGIGMRVVRDQAELTAAMVQAREVARRSFASDGLFLERWIEHGRHIEFQLLADGQGGAMHLHERECSVQRRHQKVVEECPAPVIDRAELTAMADQATAFASAVGYDNVGTLEMLRAGEGDYGFLEMNTRIQVEHGVTEAVTGVDLVVAQIRLAAGDGLPDAIGAAAAPGIDGHALEARVYAEHPHTQLPSTGRLAVFRPPRLHGVRVDTGYRAGQTVTPFYDPLLAKVIGHGTTRAQAIGRVLVALKAFEVEGVATNIPLLAALLSDEEFLAGTVDTGTLPRLLANGFRAS